MNIIENAEKECAVLGALFQGIVNEMKVGISIELLFALEKKLRISRPFNPKVFIIPYFILRHSNDSFNRQMLFLFL